MMLKTTATGVYPLHKRAVPLGINPHKSVSARSSYSPFGSVAHRGIIAFRVAAFVLAAVAGSVAQSQTAITGWTLTTGTNTTNTGYTNAGVDNLSGSGAITFQNNTTSVATVTTAGGVTMYVDNSSIASQAFVRRNGASNVNSSVWERQNGSSTNLFGRNTSLAAYDTAPEVLLQNNVNMGLNDVFTNSGGNPVEANTNIERLDYYWSGGFKVQSTAAEGFVVFDRNNGTTPDGFKIAVFTKVDEAGKDLDLATAGTPTTYSGNVVTVTTSNYFTPSSPSASTLLDVDPSATTTTTFNWSTLRFAGSGDSLTPLDVLSTGSTQGVSGVFISFANLGIAAGTTVYGYSIMAPDALTASGSTIANVADWTNTTYYPGASPDTSASLDIMAFGGRRVIPEPSTYGAISLGLGIAFFGWRRWRSPRVQRAG